MADRGAFDGAAARAEPRRPTVPPPRGARTRVRPVEAALVAALAVAGLLAIGHLAVWWFRPEHVRQPLLFVVLSVAVWYGIARMAVVWYGYLHLAAPPSLPAPPGRRVAVFTTSSPGEPLEMFRRTLSALRRVRYPHVTYLLDDTRDPAFGRLARELGAVHLEILDEPGAKAGKVNVALQRTDEEFVLVMDPDHVPHPEILDRVLGHFDDERVGFVQVCQGYYNQHRSLVARAAAEQTYGFYGPVMMGMHGVGATVAIGANCTFRRQALESIGGHGIGLAEDLVTSIRLHGAGWKSVYVPEVLTRGLVPEDLGSFAKQQLKWARGVYEVLSHDYPRCFRGLTWRQRISYLAIGTYYFFGATAAAYLSLPLLYLAGGWLGASMDFSEFLLRGVPVAVAGSSMYLFTQRWLGDPSRERGIHWRGTLMKIGLWHVYLRGTILGVLRRDVRYVPTPKEAVRGRFLRLARVPLAVAGLTVGLVAWALTLRYVSYSVEELAYTSPATWAMIGFAAFNLVTSLGIVATAWAAARPTRSIPARARAFEREVLGELGLTEEEAAP